MSEYRDGYRDGFKDALRQTGVDEWELESRRREEEKYNPKPKPKRRQSAKQKLLKTMTDAKWKKYKRGSGKKTWVQIRAEVSRSQLYKKKARRMK